MPTYTAVVVREPDSEWMVAHVPGFPGAHAQGRTLNELNDRLAEVVGMLLEDGPPELESEFVGIVTVRVAEPRQAAHA